MTAPPDTMRAVIAPTPGGPDALVLATRPVAQPDPNQVLIRVAAAGVNRPDLIQRAGHYPPPDGASDILGLEVAGAVISVGSAVTTHRVGDAVCALVAAGGYAEYVVADAGSVLPVPDGLSVRDAAGLPETVFTVWTNLFDRGRLTAGETALIHGGAGGVGVTAIQMAAARGARVIATAGSDAKVALCRELGAAIAINHRAEDFAAAVEADGGADVVLDMVGGPYVAAHLRILKPDGRLVQIAFLDGAKAQIDLRPVMLKRLTITGSTLRARPSAEKARIAAAVRKTVWPWITAGQVRPVIDATFPLKDAARAHARMEARDHAGKILLIP